MPDSLTSRSSPLVELPSGTDAFQRYSNIIGRPMDNTAMTDYMSCPKKYEYGMVQHRRSKGNPSPSLVYGSGWHAAMELHYKAEVCSEEDLIDQVRMGVAEKWQLSSNVGDHRTYERCMLEYERYLKKYGLPWLEEAKTVGWPGESALVEIAVEVPIPGARHPYTGKIDRIYGIHGQLYVEDHKTTSQLRSDFFTQFELHNQMMGYAVDAWVITGKVISGVRINAHVVHKNDSIFERRTIMFSQPRLEDWQRNYDYWLDRIEQDMVKRQVGDPSAFPRNFSACAGKYGMCQYAGVCSMPPSMRQAMLEQDFIDRPWNPLEVAEEGEL
jgi:hypothetical protein